MKAWLLLMAAFGGVLWLTMLQSFDGVAAPEDDSPAITYAHGTVRSSIPFAAPHGGAGQLTVEVLDPDDHVLASFDQHVAVHAGKGHWQQELKLVKPMGLEELAWQRLHYRFAYDGQSADSPAIEGTESISQVLRMPVVHILGQQSYLSGAAAAVRVILTDSKNAPIAGASTIRIELAPEGRKPRTLFSGPLNARGTAEAQFRFPAGLVGAYPLHYVAETPLGQAEFTEQVRLDDKAAILLTTEKPLYQPGQTIHVRALALDRARHEATGGRKLTFELEDARGNKVFKKATQTDRFGIASAEFELADEVNLGTYHLRALMGEPGAATNTAEVALQVERYVLPKFKVALDFAGKDNRVKRGYRPGDHVTGTVRANYFFGKAVDAGEVSVKASGMDVTQFEAVSAHGKTDGEGAYRFDLRLPEYFAGRPLSHGAARVLIEATVKDAAGHSETRGEPVTVSQSPLIVTAVPEGGTLIPDLENQVFVITAYPDGTPARSTVRVHVPGGADQKAETDEGGVAVIQLRAGAGQEKVEIEARDQEGNHTSSTVQLEARDGAEQILLRADHAVYRAGDRITLRVLSTKKRGTAYVDLVKEGQTMLTRDLDIVNGQAELSLNATPDLSGTVDIHAYLFGQDAQPLGDHRLIFVQPADELKIEATADAAGYKPGGEARIRFHVTNGKGEGVEAALGLQVVDEAVFALAEKQPGMAKVFFYLEQEAMKPRYEIHSLAMPEVVEPVPAAQAAQRDRAARALFSATEMVNGNQFETQFGSAIPTTKYAEVWEQYQRHYRAQVVRVAEMLSRGYAHDGGDLTKIAAQVKDPAMRDAWGNRLQLERIDWAPQRTYYQIRSAGPDKMAGTTDDLISYLEIAPGRKMVARPAPGGSQLEVSIEHDRGPFNGRAELFGSAMDQRGEALEGATVTARTAFTEVVRSTWVNAEGHFSIAGLPPGEYEVQVTSGQDSVSRRVVLRARDRGGLTAILRQDAGGNQVVVVDEPAHRRIRDELRMADLRLNMAKEMFAVNGAAAMIGRGRPAPLPAAAPQMILKSAAAGNIVAAKVEPAAPATHVRSYFPEALYINPEIITDHNGTASITIPLADSITTWRMAMMASTMHGALGSGVSSLKVFQDFFVDLDLPVTLTQGDRVSIPVAVYNYSAERGDVRLDLKQEDWFRLVDDQAGKNLGVDSGRVGAAQFTVEAQRIGKFKLTLAAHMSGGNNPADIVVREIEVVPNGREQSVVFNGRLESTAGHDIRFPVAAIADASKLIVRLYPGPLSQVVEGMDAILRMPFGCFEQTSSATYPNVLALDYMKRTKKLTPEVHAKAEGFIANGYQRLLTFEVQGGGFSWFGNPPANKILTAYGLMEFSDMAQVHDVDARLIERTQHWLAGQQQGDGSWKPDTNFINEGATNRFNTDVLRITAYLGWSLVNTGYKGPAVEKAKEYVSAHMNGKADAYTLAVVANFAAEYGRDREFTRRAMQMLLDARTEKDEQAWWTAEETGVYGGGASASVETTGLAVQALLKWGESGTTAGKALLYIASKKDASGTWGTTQATIMALRALLLSTGKGAADVRGTVEVSVDGKTVQKLTLTPENNDLLHQFVFPVDARNAQRVDLRFDGKGGLAYQVVGRYFIPWGDQSAGEPLSIDVAYDRTHMAQDDIATATATVKNNLHKTANMVMVDLGIPPGFDLLSEDLQAYQEKSRERKSGRLEKFSLTATQAILYFDGIGAGDTVTLQFRLRAKYPIRARTFQSRVYEYYDPAVSAVARPVTLEVGKNHARTH